MYEVTIRFNDDGSVTLVPPKAKPKEVVSPATTQEISMEVFKKQSPSTRNMPEKIRILTRRDTEHILERVEKVKQKMGFTDRYVALQLGYGPSILSQWRNQTECISQRAYDTAMAFTQRYLKEEPKRPVAPIEMSKDDRRKAGLDLIAMLRKTYNSDAAIQDALDLPSGTFCHWKAGRTTPTEHHLALLRSLAK